MQKIFAALSRFPRKRFLFRHFKFAKKWKMTFSNPQNVCFWSQVASKPFSEKLPMAKFWLIALNILPHFPRKWFQLCQSKTCKKLKKFYFQAPTILVLELKEASKPFSKNVPMTKFWFKQFLMFYLTFPTSEFNFLTQKLQKN